MTDKPIIFSAPMVRALLDGRKTQTRRVLKPQPTMHDAGDCTIRGHRGSVDYLMRDVAPRFWAGYAHGDHLWVREAWAPSPLATALIPSAIYKADGEEVGSNARWRSSIFMPRWASRLTLLVTDVRVQRVQEISLGDADREGWPGALETQSWTAIEWFSDLWNEINAKRGFGWDANPWVAALTFRVERRKEGK